MDDTLLLNPLKSNVNESEKDGDCPVGISCYVDRASFVPIGGRHRTATRRNSQAYSRDGVICRCRYIPPSAPNLIEEHITEETHVLQTNLF